MKLYYYEFCIILELHFCRVNYERGWLNDLNGLCQFHGSYHIYYQYTPFEPTGELKSWGHSNNFESLLFIVCAKQ